MRLAVYCDFAYRRDGEELWADQAFSVFMAGLRPWVGSLVLAGRLDPAGGRWNYRIPDDVGFAALPHYSSLSEPVAALRAMRDSVRAFGRVLDDADAVWLLGPHPLAIVFAIQALLRRRRVVLGVRQHLPAYARNRHPGRRGIVAAALGLEAIYRALALRLPVVAVGPDIARGYRRARAVLPASISLVPAARIASEPVAAPREGEEVRILSVGRLDAEKNPLLLADIAARLGPGFRLLVCGDGPLADALRERAVQLGVAERLELLGYVPFDAGLQELYRSSHLLLHVSWTEGFPQVLVEAFAAGLPCVATAVGGVEGMAGDAARLVGPGDAEAAAAAVRELARDERLRCGLAERGFDLVAGHTLEATTRAVAGFIARAGA